ncbi:MAG: translocation/assembly module TamB domain-containing protein [Thiobacillus sp.]|nr:translocation/assembly module TamB domain-containing protein [Thiobacillus sp.]
MKRGLRWALALLALCGGVFALGAYLVATQSGLLTLTRAAAALSADRFVFEGGEGRLTGPFAFKRVEIRTATQNVVLDDVRVQWQPASLFDGRVEIDQLAIRAARITATQVDDTPLVPPASLRLPFDVQMRAFELGALIRTDISGASLKLTSVRAALDGRGDRWRLSALRADAPWAELAASLEIGKDAPFGLAGRIEARRNSPLAWQARATLAGSLLAPGFDLNATGGALRLMMRGEAAPFAAVRLTHLLVAGEGLDPRLFAAGAPAADVAFSGVFEGRPGERLFGSFSLLNRAAGRLDRQRLPLSALSGAVLGDAVHADFSNLSVDLGKAGHLAGQGAWREGRFSLALDGKRLDLAGVHRDLAATRLAVQLGLSGDAERQTLDVSVKERWGEGKFSLLHADRVLALTEARFAGEAGRLLAHGSLMLDAGRAFALNFDASRINPARFGAFPRGRLNATGEASGALAPTLMLNARLTLPPGELEGRPVGGEARIRYAQAHLADALIDLDLAGNRVQAQGAWGRSGDRLAWTVDAPALARLNLGLAGRLSSRGTLFGQPDAPSVEAQADARGLHLPGAVEVDRLAARLTLLAGERGTFAGQLDAQGMAFPGGKLTRAQASLAGRREAHTLSLDIDSEVARVRALLSGGLDAAATAWQGQLRSADVSGSWPARLLAPAALELSRQHQRVTSLEFTFAGGRVSLAELRRDGASLVSRGAIADLPLAPLAGLIEPPLPTTTDLVVSGDWNLQWGTQLNGVARLYRVRGDVRLNDPAMALGLTQLKAGLRASGSHALIDLDIDTRDAGQARLSARLPIAVEAGLPALMRSAPLSGSARLAVPDLRVLRPFLPVGVRLDARLAANLEARGSLITPELSGNLRADNVRFALPEQGIGVVDGSLDLALAGDRVSVRQGELKGAGGRILLTGEAELRNPRAGLMLNFEKFVATQRSDRRVTVSGPARLALADSRIRLTGDLLVDRARLEMPESSRPELSDDVVVVGRSRAEPGAGQRYPLALDLTVGLGEDFLFRGAGLDARLGGKLRILTVDKMLHGEGTIRVEKGRYAAYAQTLDIERGVLRFNGPIDNPGLDVLAVRKTPTVKAGVQVRGTVQRPVVTLYSDPPLPDTEKLSWLVLGHGLDSAGQQEFVLMQVAASALLSQAESVNFQARLAETLHIDSFDVRAGNTEDVGTAIVSVGKRLSSRATLSYEQSLDGLNQVVKVLYQLTPNVRLEAQAGQRSSFDAFYTLEFD